MQQHTLNDFKDFEHLNYDICMCLDFRRLDIDEPIEEYFKTMYRCGCSIDSMNIAWNIMKTNKWQNCNFGDVGDYEKKHS